MLSEFKTAKDSCFLEYHCLTLILDYLFEFDSLYKERLVEFCQVVICHLLLTFVLCKNGSKKIIEQGMSVLSLLAREMAPF